MNLESLASDPAALALFDRVCALVSARGSGLSLKHLSAARALARAMVEGDGDRVQDMALHLGIDVEALR